MQRINFENERPKGIIITQIEALAQRIVDALPPKKNAIAGKTNIFWCSGTTITYHWRSIPPNWPIYRLPERCDRFVHNDDESSLTPDILLEWKVEVIRAVIALLYIKTHHCLEDVGYRPCYTTGSKWTPNVSATGQPSNITPLLSESSGLWKQYFSNLYFLCQSQAWYKKNKSSCHLTQTCWNGKSKSWWNAPHSIELRKWLRNSASLSTLRLVPTLLRESSSWVVQAGWSHSIADPLLTQEYRKLWTISTPPFLSMEHVCKAKQLGWSNLQHTACTLCQHSLSATRTFLVLVIEKSKALQTTCARSWLQVMTRILPRISHNMPFHSSQNIPTVTQHASWTLTSPTRVELYPQNMTAFNTPQCSPPRKYVREHPRPCWAGLCQSPAASNQRQIHKSVQAMGSLPQSKQ